MVIREQVQKSIAEMPEGVVFTASDLSIPREYRATLVKALNQFEYAGVLKRLSKGRYYKPRISRFGELPPSEIEIVKDFLEKDGKVIGYITGTRAFASLALTTQISSVIEVGTNVSRRPMMRGQYRISFPLQPNPIIEEDIPYLRLLDALKSVKRIPACTPDEAAKQIMAWIEKMSRQEQDRLLQLSFAYPPYVRALVGAIFEAMNRPADDLRNTLNPISRYMLGIKPSTIPTTLNWNIV